MTKLVIVIKQGIEQKKQKIVGLRLWNDFWVVFFFELILLSISFCFYFLSFLLFNKHKSRLFIFAQV